MEINEMFSEIQEKEAVEPIIEAKEVVKQVDQTVRTAEAEKGEQKQEIQLDEKQFKQFERALEKLFKKKVPTLQQDNIEYNKDRLYLDSACVLGIHFKNTLLEKWFNQTFEATAKDYPELDYSETDNRSSLYCSDYLFKIMSVFKIFEQVKLSLNNEYPLSAENDQIKIVLAPKIENEY